MENLFFKRRLVMKKKAIMVLVMLGCGLVLSAEAVQMSSDSFPYKYEASVLPSAASPAYTYNSTTTLESAYATVTSGVLKLDTDTNPTSNEGAYYELTGGTGTTWNPAPAGPFTAEVRMKSLPNNSASYNAWFYWFDVNSAILLQVWANKVYLNGVEVTGLDNQSAFHVYRIVSDAYSASADQKFDLYRDGVLIINDVPNIAEFSGAKFQFGDMTGYAESNVEIDYIRWDDSNAWEPIPAGESAGYPYRYEADVLPSAFSPAYAYASGNGLLETAYATITNGILKLDTDTIGTGSDSGWYSLTGGTGTVWDPHFLGGYTMEVRMKSLPNNASAYNAWFYWYDLNSATLMQVWSNKVYLNGVEVTGLDNQSAFHDFRIVSEMAASSADQKFDLYRDGVLIIDDAPNWTDFTAYYAGVNGLVKFGDMTGTQESNIEIDYIRWDTTGAYTPIPEPATMMLLIGGLVLSFRRK
jgi:hypothetical protein